MTYFADLSPYTYGLDEPCVGDGAALNVGWLDRDHPFQVGETPAGLVDGLVRLCARPVHLTRGLHFCELCPQLTPDEHRKRWNELTTFRSALGDVFVGNGEVRVQGIGGAVYAAPTLILHYITEHGYLPPDDFVEGVILRD